MRSIATKCFTILLVLIVTVNARPLHDHDTEQTTAPLKLERVRCLAHREVPCQVEKRGIPGLPGDIEYMSFYGSLISIPTLLSVMGVQTNYNVQKSYYQSQINALYYKQSRDLLRMHEAQLIRQQEPKYLNAGEGWEGMTYDAHGNLNVKDGSGSTESKSALALDSANGFLYASRRANDKISTA